MTDLTQQQRILELEHATIRPLGEDPDHCSRCRDVVETRLLQAGCVHPAEARVEVDITGLGDVRPRILAHCGRCGKALSAGER